MEGDREISRIVIQSRHFNPLPPHGGRRPEDKFDFVVGSHFNPLPPHGGRQGFPEIHLPLPAYFNPLPPHGGRREHRLSDIEEALHFNPLPPHGGRREIPADWNCHEIISIHSLRMEGDLTQQQQNYVFANISIHSLRMEGDSSFCSSRNGTFYISIHSLRMEGDAQLETIAFERLYFNPLPPHGGRRKVSPGSNGGKNFNPLPPHGGRPILVLEIFPDDLFQSTPSAWRETAKTNAGWKRCRKFQSTPSAWRETAFFPGTYFPELPFQSTPSAWRETTFLYPVTTGILFQSTPSAWRETISATPHVRRPRHFNPLPPHGGRHSTDPPTPISLEISIHSLRMEGDKGTNSTKNTLPKFQSTPSAWRETFLSQLSFPAQKNFNPLPPHGGRRQAEFRSPPEF